MTGLVQARGTHRVWRAFCVWRLWVQHPSSASERYLEPAPDAQARRVEIRQVWIVSIVLQSALNVLHELLLDPSVLVYPAAFVPTVITPILSAVLSLYAMQLALRLFGIRLEKDKLVAFHSAFVIAYLPLWAAAPVFAPMLTMDALHQVKLAKLDLRPSLAMLFDAIVKTDSARNPVLDVASSVMNSTVVLAMGVLLTLYARKIRDHTGTELFRVLVSLTLGQALYGGIAGLLAMLSLAFVYAFC